jgi:hypothetical protein
VAVLFDDFGQFDLPDAHFFTLELELFGEGFYLGLDHQADVVEAGEGYAVEWVDVAAACFGVFFLD